MKVFGQTGKSRKPGMRKQGNKNRAVRKPKFVESPLYASCVQVFKHLRTPFASAIKNRLAKGEYREAISIAMPDPHMYSDPSEFARDYLAYGLLRKSLHLPVDVDRELECMSKWRAAEHTCRWINRNHGCDPFEDVGPLNGSLEAAIWSARLKIRNLLGEFNWDRAYPYFGYSGGASTRLKRRNGHQYYKFSGKPHVTRKAALLGVCAIWHSTMWREMMHDTCGSDPMQWVEIVDGSTMTTVSKTALTDRPICIEPDLNMYLQKGIGGLIRQLLKTAGVDLNDQTHNQYLAWVGSRTGSLATIDLSSASDSVALSLVELLLPRDWYEAICTVRCEVTSYEGENIVLEKVSSMGNGFTFELESLIFWALTASAVEICGCADKRIGIYGDDIVIHNSAADYLVRLLRRCGFQTNGDKTFLSGPFRESCGKHYFHGTDVTPFYVKEQDGHCITDLFWYRNQLSEWNERGTMPGLTGEIGKIDRLIRNRLGFIPYVPRDDGLRAGVIAPLDVACPKWDRDAQQWAYTRFTPVRQKHKPNGVPAMLARLAVHARPPRESRNRRWVNQAQQYRIDGYPDEVAVELVVEKGDVIYAAKVAHTSRWCG